MPTEILVTPVAWEPGKEAAPEVASDQLGTWLPPHTGQRMLSAPSHTLAI